jgi:hypothetical protein
MSETNKRKNSKGYHYTSLFATDNKRNSNDSMQFPNKFAVRETTSSSSSKVVINSST